MKIHNTAVFAGDQTIKNRHNGDVKQQEGKETIFAGNMSKKLDPIAKKREEAKKQALKIVGEAWENDKKIDNELADSRSRIAGHKATMSEMNDKLKEIDNRRLELRDSYGLTEEDQEQQDLHLLEKRINAKKPGSEISFTKEEQERLQELDKAGLTEYQQRSLEMKAGGAPYEKELTEAAEGIRQETAAITSIKNGMLKNQGMLKADASAEELLAATAKDLASMLIDEAKDNIDKKMEEEKEAAEEKAEKEEELEERIEKRDDKEDKQEQIKEQISDSTSNMVELDKVMGDVQKEVKKIMDEMKLTEEDIKGAAVDTLQ